MPHHRNMVRTQCHVLESRGGQRGAAGAHRAALTRSRAGGRTAGGDAAADWVLVVCGYDAAVLDALSGSALVNLGTAPGAVHGCFALSLSATPADMR